jgi:hypothetical protein
MQRHTTRHLICIPIIHTEADLGSLSESIRRLHIERTGLQQWDRRIKTVDEMWRTIRAQIQSLNLDYIKTRLYQDGLPTCGHEEKIIRDLAQAGSQNHRVLLELMEKGARLVGTESPELLLEEYDLARQVLVSLCEGTMGRADQDPRGGRGKDLLEKRDRYIAERINETLVNGEGGLIFLGLLHSLEGYLPMDIKVTYLGS